ncbi:olfactomedin-like protein 3B [Sphaeramia orbicularis]|uniref:Olfactomedin-like protein 3B n=1 Tax=Sphaeramia orbicularis TaxID=375764 RepID=A0A673BJJ7_9TELE|nr:olfactomedin-like protein 3B [Sphaeramia orbicularis]
MKPALVLLLCTVWTFSGAQYYYQGLMDYLENRLLAIEDRMHLWHEQTHRYHTELQDFKKLSAEAVDALGKEHAMLFKDLEGAVVKVDRVEREMDYVETQTSPRACVNKADKVVEQGEWSLKESRGEEEEEEDWEELYSRVSDCVEIIAGIRSVKILKRVGSPKGMWTRDPRSSKVYVFNGTSGDTVFQFNSVRDFSNSSGVTGSRQIKLPDDWRGPGSAVYNDHLYYIKHEADAEVQVVKYDLMSGSVTDIAMFPLDNLATVYSLNPEIIADLAADDEGLWLLYASSDNEPNINLAKMDPATLDIEQIWDTRCPRENAEAAFVVCGTIYVVYNTRLASRSRVQCVFDVNDMVISQEAPLIYFPRRYGAHASLKYNPEERQLYGWDDGYQIIYRLTMKRKLLV